MDWNWFFSSLSQSAAAIVGIFGAFIITKILSNQAAFSEKQNRLRDMVRAAEKLAADAGSLYFKWYNKHTTSQEFHELLAILDKDATGDAEALYDKLRFSPYVARSDIVTKIEAILEARREYERTKLPEDRESREIETILRNARSFLSQDYGFNAFAIPAMRDVSTAPTLNIGKELTQERDSIDASVRACRHHILRISDFSDSIRDNPESSPQITYALLAVLILFYVGVIYPLSFMPLPLNAKLELSLFAFFEILFSIKGALLTAIAIIFSSVLAMFFKMNVELRYSPTDQAALQRYSAMDAYSAYFAIMDENNTILASRRSSTASGSE